MSNELLFILQMIVSLSFVVPVDSVGIPFGYIGFVILSQIFVNKQFDLFGRRGGMDVSSLSFKQI